MQLHTAPFVLILALSLGACAPNNTMNPTRSGLDSASVPSSAPNDARGPEAAAGPVMPRLDAAAAGLIGSGKYETATFALG